jgi:pyruvate kinase
LISKYRPAAQIYAFSYVLPVCNRMNLLWGVHPLQRDMARSAEDMVKGAEHDLVRLGRVNPGDVLGVVAGIQMASGSTNFMRLHVVGEKVTGKARRARQTVRK